MKSHIYIEIKHILQAELNIEPDYNITTYL